jgi:phage-related protein
MDVFDLFAKITLDSSEYEKQLGEAGSKTSGFADKLKSGLATAGQVAGAGLAAATTAIAGLGKASIEGYADYEQLVGGVETLFGDSADTVMGYAENAFKTAGLSANDYMSTVTSFSASLLQSLGGDTEAAAQYANQAITDMSDNANKMGTSMESIQNAYAGFAKSNFTMLDNLKLGRLRHCRA